MTKAVASILGVAGAIMLFVSCQKKDANYSDIPQITYQGISMTRINAATDSGDWYMYYDFVDGNGDLGTEMENAPMRVFMKDTISGTEYQFPFPYISPQERNGKKYLKGYGNIRLSIPVFFPLPPGVDSDTAVFTLHIVDDAGNLSNVITADPVIIYR